MGQEAAGGDCDAALELHEHFFPETMNTRAAARANVNGRSRRVRTKASNVVGARISNARSRSALQTKVALIS
jgi:hypothetical protein